MFAYLEAITIFFNALIFSWVIIEFVYSLIKKDKNYPISSSFHNFLKFLISNLLAKTLYPIFFYIYAIGFEKIIPITYNSQTLNLAQILLLVLAVDFCYYIAHYLHHRLKILSAIHFVHHSANVFNLTLAWRLAWVQKLYYPLFYLPILLLGFSPAQIMIAVFLDTTYQATSHSSYLTLPKWLSYILITPESHRIHHDQALVNQNSNFGGIFSIWDRLFGTYVSDIKEFTPGIKGYSQDNFIMMEVDPIVRYVKSVIK